MYHRPANTTISVSPADLLEKRLKIMVANNFQCLPSKELCITALVLVK